MRFTRAEHYFITNGIVINIYNDINVIDYFESELTCIVLDLMVHENIKKVHFFISSDVPIYYVNNIMREISSRICFDYRNIKVVVHYIHELVIFYKGIIVDTSNVSYFSFHDYCYRVSLGNVSGISTDKITIERMIYEKQNNG